MTDESFRLGDAITITLREDGWHAEIDRGTTVEGIKPGIVASHAAFPTPEEALAAVKRAVGTE